jgi:hypothetical protein
MYLVHHQQLQGTTKRKKNTLVAIVSTLPTENKQVKHSTKYRRTREKNIRH